MLYAIDKWASEYGSKLVLWGCSIENNCSSEMLSDLSRFDLIIARESLTADYLRSKLRTRILCMPDPAFTLPPDSDESYCLPENTVGINISPMVMNYELDNGIAFKNYAVLVQYILQNTSYHVALIPHVTAPLSNDMIPLKKILDKFKEFRDRVTLVQDGNCKKLKYAISQCRFFIGARTHATIAAYSSCVPTIVLGYSVKSRGIARDLFGEEKNYVLPVQNLKTEKDLINAFCRMERDENLIRKRLEEIMPTYIGQAKNAVKEVMKILG